MKTARHWTEEVPIVEHNEQDKIIDFIKQIQLDAWKQGVMDCAGELPTKEQMIRDDIHPALRDAMLSIKDELLNKSNNPPIELLL